VEKGIGAVALQVAAHPFAKKLRKDGAPGWGTTVSPRVSVPASSAIRGQGSESRK